MIRSHLSTLMGRHRMKIADVARVTGMNRSTITALYYDTASRLDASALSALCELFACRIEDLLEYVPDKNEGENKDKEQPPPRA